MGLPLALRCTLPHVCARTHIYPLHAPHDLVYARSFLRCACVCVFRIVCRFVFAFAACDARVFVLRWISFVAFYAFSMSFRLRSPVRCTRDSWFGMDFTHFVAVLRCTVHFAAILFTARTHDRFTLRFARLYISSSSFCGCVPFLNLMSCTRVSLSLCCTRTHYTAHLLPAFATRCTRCRFAVIIAVTPRATLYIPFIPLFRDFTYVSTRFTVYRIRYAHYYLLRVCATIYVVPCYLHRLHTVRTFTRFTFAALPRTFFSHEHQLHFILRCPLPLYAYAFVTLPAYALRFHYTCGCRLLRFYVAFLFAARYRFARNVRLDQLPH